MPAALAATLWMTGAIASFSTMAVAGRELAGRHDVFEILGYRSVVGWALVIGFGLACGRLAEARTGCLRVHLLRNTAHFAGQSLWFFAIPLIPLAQLFAIEFTTPLWVALLAPLVLGEGWTRARLAAAGLGFLGVLVVARPGLTPVDIGHVATLVAAICFAANVMVTKILSRTETVWTIMFWMTAMQAIFGLALAGADGAIALPTAQTAGWLVLVGIGGLTAHLCIASALSLAPASVVSPMDFLRLPVIAVVGMVLYGEPLEIAVFAGAALILAGNFVNIRAGGRA
jgi:drug/metabolite transporter (DMT)-like permease